METIEKQKTFRHCLLYYLDCSYRQYEALKYGYFLTWCEQVNRKKRTVTISIIGLMTNGTTMWSAI